MKYDKAHAQTFNDIKTAIIRNVDFKNGVISNTVEDILAPGLCIDVCWKGNIHFQFYNIWNRFHYAVMKDKEPVSSRYYVTRIDEKLFRSIQKLVNAIENGDYNNKKTQSELIADIILRRGLTSCMNETKWREFLYAMTEEMSLFVPYDYKTLFEAEHPDLLWGTAYDIESFNYYHFKSIEWVKLKPKFAEHIYKGRLIDDDIIYHDVEKEFISLMEKYNIPYEYNQSEEVYVIYGYKSAHISHKCL